MSFGDKVAQAPDSPGVYLLKDAQGQVLYIGKARNLRERLRSYTQPQDNPRIAALQARLADLETVITRSEVEALILEENFIKMKKPRYNVRLKDDKKFPYIRITTSEPFPRLFVTRNVKQDGSLFFGPYTATRELRKAVRAVKRIFRLRTCKREIAVRQTPKDSEPQRHSDGRKQEDSDSPDHLTTRSPGHLRTALRPCLEADLGRCTAPCAGRVTREEYQAQVRDVIAFLSGRSDELEKRMEERMWAASESRRYEVAAALRDQLMALREIRKDQQAVIQDRTSRDVVGLARGARTALAALFRVREGKVVAREEYPLSAARDAPDAEVLSALVRSVHGHTADLPDEIVLPAPVEDAQALETLLSERRGRKVKILVPERGEKVRLLALATANAEKALVELRPEERVPKGSRELARILGLERIPRLIEGVDISNTQGTNAVGSIVVFRDDRPARQLYRLFKVKTVTGADDFAMMEEVLTRRVRGLIEQNRPLPDLVLVDGGKGQLSAAIRAYRLALRKTEQKMPDGGSNPRTLFLGLAKRTDTLYYLDGREITIPVSSPAMKLLKRIRDESHRFAITFHRKLRGKAQTKSELDDIPGIGPARKRALILHFGSLEKLKSASLADIARVKGIGPALAEKLLRELRR